MTNEEFLEKQELIVRGLPEEVRSFVRAEAWEHSHSEGYVAVLMKADWLANDLREALKPTLDLIRTLVATLDDARNFAFSDCRKVSEQAHSFLKDCDHG
jgi:hypothetical protein